MGGRRDRNSSGGVGVNGSGGEQGLREAVLVVGASPDWPGTRLSGVLKKTLSCLW